MEQTQALPDIPAKYLFEGYIRPLTEDGVQMWALFDCEGVPVCISEYRSAPFFFAAEHEITVRMLN